MLFVDVVGSTALADGADPEDVRDRNQLYYDEVRSRIERHGGIVEKGLVPVTEVCPRTARG